MQQNIKLYNTLTRKKELFRPRKKGRVGLYTCGPTVYNFAHIGNLRTYVFEDILRRTLEYGGYAVRHVMNITDVGHLTSDADAGEDKLEQKAVQEKESPWDIARFYTTAFLEDIAKLNIQKAHVLAPATKYIPEQVALIKKLFKNRYAYDTPEAVYFDASKFKGYGKLSGQKLAQKKVGARSEVVAGEHKKHPYDFALWFKRVGRFKNHLMHWPSPWGEGFPGWHIECSAISTKFLGQPFDIHTGGVDHIAVHHTNEIAQSEAAHKKSLAAFWLHGEFLSTGKEKMSKSKENFLTLNSILAKEIDPLAFRYLILTAHYRSKLKFTWASLAAAERALQKLRDFVAGIATINPPLTKMGVRGVSTLSSFQTKFDKAIFDDLNTPVAIATLWDLIHAYRKSSAKFDAKKLLNLIYDFDQVLGLNLKSAPAGKLPAEIEALLKTREDYRREKNWAAADKTRKKIETLGYRVEDTPSGPVAKKI